MHQRVALAALEQARLARNANAKAPRARVPCRRVEPVGDRTVVLCPPPLEVAPTACAGLALLGNDSYRHLVIEMSNTDNQPRPRRRSAVETREHVLTVAHELFYWQGIRGTSVDTVAAEAAVAPTTLYRLFASKDELIAAYVQRAGDGYRAWFDDDAVAAGGPGARGQILAVFDALDEQTQPHLCRGCPFLMALAEVPDPEHGRAPGRRGHQAVGPRALRRPHACAAGRRPRAGWPTSSP